MKRKLHITLLFAVLSLSLAGCNIGGGNSTSTSHEHRYGAITYTWTDDYSACSAERVCLDDPTHKQSGYAVSTYEELVEATCESTGIRRYTATFSNSVFETQTADVTTAAKGHNYRTTYNWSSDHSSCTARRVCLRCDTPEDSETVTSRYEVVTQESNEQNGQGKYIAEFTNEIFSTQTYYVSIPKDELATRPYFYNNNKNVYYGIYPQSVVTSTSMISELNELTSTESNGWYLYEGHYYAKTVAQPFDNSTYYQFNDGTPIIKDQTYWFKCEPISWNVIRNFGSGLYYLNTSMLIDTTYYHHAEEDTREINNQTVYANNYEYCDLRAWLNDDFYHSAFALNDSYIQVSNVINDAGSTIPDGGTAAQGYSNPYACNDTQDKIYVPCVNEYFYYDYGYPTNTGQTVKRCFVPTDWARARGAEYYTVEGDYFNFGTHWTRSPRNTYYYFAYCISNDGTTVSFSNNRSGISVRPAMRIQISN